MQKSLKSTAQTWVSPLRKIARLRPAIAAAEATHAANTSALESAGKLAGLAGTALQCAEEALTAATAVAALTQRAATEAVAEIATRCLAAVFPDPYKVRIILEEKRGKTEATVMLERRGLLVEPMDATGGGVIDVAAFGLRVAALVLGTTKYRRFLALDEPFKYVSAEYIPALRELIQRLAEEMEIQFLIVTHIPDLVCGKVVEL